MTSSDLTPQGDLTAEIRREHDAAQDAYASAVEHAVRCGKLLAEQKGRLPHGGWLPWLDEQFPASRRTAQGYMRLARHAEDAQALAHLGIEGVLRQLAAPPPPDPRIPGSQGQDEDEQEVRSPGSQVPPEPPWDDAGDADYDETVAKLAAATTVEECVAIMHTADRMMNVWPERNREIRRAMESALADLRRATSAADHKPR